MIVEVHPMKWKRTTLLALLMLAAFAAGAIAASQIEQVTAFIRHDYQVLLNGKKADVGNILVYDDVSYLPLRSMGDLLDADVSFNASTKTIHVTREEPGKPAPGQPSPGQPQDDPEEHQNTAALYSMMAYTMHWNEREYPVLAFMDMNYKLYYRDRDLKRANIDTGGMGKTKEALTEELYVSDDELNRRMKPAPQFSYNYNSRLIIGENEPARLKAVIDYIEFLPELQKLLRNDPYYYYPVPTIVLIERIQGNDYVILTIENDTYIRYNISMMKSDSGKWDTQTVNRETLGSPYDYYGIYSY